MREREPLPLPRNLNFDSDLLSIFTTFRIAYKNFCGFKPVTPSNPF